MLKPSFFMKIMLRTATLLFLVAMTASCKKDKTNDLEGAWLFPIAKGNLSINSFSDLKNLRYQIEVPALSIGQPINIPISSPGLHISHVGPFPVLITDWLHRVDIDTLKFSGSLNNFFPIPIGEGTVVSMRNSRDTSAASIVGVATIASPVEPGESFGFDIEVYNKTLGDSVFFFLDNFNSPPYNNVVFATTPARLEIQLNVVTAKYVEIYTNKSFSARDTSAFSTNSENVDNSGGLSDTSLSGVINVFTDNGLPANVSGQFYFLDESRTQVLDSFFLSNLIIGGGQTDAAGSTTFVSSKKAVVPVTRKKLNNMKRARYVATHFELNTSDYSGPYVRANKGPRLSIQFTGDLNILIWF
jgi:hypothetical protein